MMGSQPRIMKTPGWKSNSAARSEQFDDELKKGGSTLPFFFWSARIIGVDSAPSVQ
ncbi:hypothetical protein TL5118_01172 [Thalassovita autumnalis]|uniref:Uncharacterized protein n=1 Tax=Thalassovita autumnalis TaxID=2072972 RepID=A0A0P1G817_9RHOB|nr:hypothetical protein TL5118_01172 [Thalassovita autumnalis]CUH71682.1 hypothetical protein TL5120_01472 [Thalassovita autumnalis]